MGTSGGDMAGYGYWSGTGTPAGDYIATAGDYYSTDTTWKVDWGPKHHIVLELPLFEEGEKVTIRVGDEDVEVSKKKLVKAILKAFPELAPHYVAAILEGKPKEEDPKIIVGTTTVSGDTTTYWTEGKEKYGNC